MRRRVAIAILAGVLLTGLMGPYTLQVVAKERASKAYNQENLIRLHIIANSNNPQDQALKYQVRDAIVAALRPELLQLHSRPAAEALLAAERDRIIRIAEQTIAANGYSYPARMEIGNFNFPTRAYGDLVLPAGNYRAVRIVLGQGAGANWWCVLFPPLCFVDVAGSGVRTGYTGKDPGETLAKGAAPTVAVKDDLNPVVDGGGVQFRLRMLDWLETESGYMARLFSS
ncbi:MAG: stage II sporulation protein R [Thermacetogeniaceae bacterium]